MRTHVAFLRAVNVGGRRLTMAALVDALAPAGLAEVATFQAAGTVAFAADGRATAASLERRIEDALTASLGYEVPAVVRTAGDVRRLAAAEPFAPELVAATAGKLQVVLVEGGEPPAPLRDEVLAAADGLDDHVAWAHDALFWLPREGISTSAFPIGRLAARLGVATVRTQRAIAGCATKLL